LKKKKDLAEKPQKNPDVRRELNGSPEARKSQNHSWKEPVMLCEGDSGRRAAFLRGGFWKEAERDKKKKVL